MYQYNAIVTKVIDGDTFDLLIDLGFNVFVQERIRLARVDAPELKTQEGKDLKAELAYLINQPVTINTKSKDRYGRYIAELFYKNNNLSDQILRENKAITYK